MYLWGNWLTGSKGLYVTYLYVESFNTTNQKSLNDPFDLLSAFLPYLYYRKIKHILIFTMKEYCRSFDPTDKCPSNTLAHIICHSNKCIWKRLISVDNKGLWASFKIGTLLAIYKSETVIRRIGMNKIILASHGGSFSQVEADCINDYRWWRQYFSLFQRFEWGWADQKSN